jgi:hypothetical protein
MIDHINKTCLFLVLVLLVPFTMYSQVEFTSSNLPIIVIETDSVEIVDEYRIVAHMGIINSDSGLRNNLSDPYHQFSGKINIEIRGSTSQVFPKKSYGFETQDNHGDVLNVSLLDFPEENDWVLYAPYTDKSLIRNILSYQLAEELGHYAPRTRLCELVLNGDYKGVYVLIEKIKRDKNRIDIAKLKPDEIIGDDLTGGYILKIDKQTGSSGPMWVTNLKGTYFQYEYPKFDEIAPEQEDYILNYLNNFEEVLVSDQFMDPEVGYRKYLNDSSFVDLFIINEISKNVDGYILSTFLFKDKESKGGKLTVGPVWDYNLSFGNAIIREGHKTEGFQVRINPSPWWWDRLIQDPKFVSAIKSRWNGLRETQFTDEAILAIIDSLSLLLEESQQRNFERWDILGHAIWPGYYVCESFEDEIDSIKTWTIDRLQWLDQNLESWTKTESISTDQESRVYPNPFMDIIHYDFALDRPGDLSLILYDINGRERSRIIDDIPYAAGSYTKEWNSSELPGSIYLLVLKINGETVSIQKVVKL